jgi:hypothetical protein
MVGEAFSVLYFFLVLINSFYLQLFLLTLLKVDASLVDGQNFLPASPQDIWDLFQSSLLILFLLLSFLTEPVMTLVYSFLSPHQKFLKGWRYIFFLDVLVYFDVAILLESIFMPMLIVGHLLLFLINFFLFFSKMGVVDWLVFLIKYLIDQFLSLLLN